MTPDEYSALQQLAELENQKATVPAGDPPSIHRKAAGMMGKDILISGLASIGQTVLGMTGNGSGEMALRRAKESGALEKPFTPTPTLSERLSKWEKENSDLAEVSPYLHAATSAAVPGVIGKLTNIIPTMAAGAAGGLSSEAVNQYLENPTLAKYLAPVAGFFTGGLTGFGLSPKQTVGQRDIRLELANKPPSAWEAASNNINAVNNSGSTTATLGEMFPGISGITALTQKAINSKGGEALREQLAGRQADLQNLGETFVNRIGPRVEPNTVANQVAKAAQGNLDGLKKIRDDLLRDTLDGKFIAPHQARELYNDLMAGAAQQTNESVRQAYLELARSLVSTDPNLIQRNLQDLSLTIKDHKTAQKNPNTARPGYTNIGSNWGRPAIADAETGLSSISPDFEQGMQDFSRLTGHWKDALEGPVGRLSNANALTARPVPEERLNAVINGNSPQTVHGIAQVLGDSRMTSPDPLRGIPGPTVAPEAIASAIAQNKLSGGPTNPGQVMRGNSGSTQEARFNALLDAAGRDTSYVNAPLHTADMLQNVTESGTIKGLANMRSGQLLLRPLRTIDMMVTGHTDMEIQREIATLLSTPTQANRARLQEIANFDPRGRAILSAYPALLSALTGAK